MHKSVFGTLPGLDLDIYFFNALEFQSMHATNYIVKVLIFFSE